MLFRSLTVGRPLPTLSLTSVHGPAQGATTSCTTEHTCRATKPIDRMLLGRARTREGPELKMLRANPQPGPVFLGILLVGNDRGKTAVDAAHALDFLHHQFSQRGDVSGLGNRDYVVRSRNRVRDRDSLHLPDSPSNFTSFAG